MKLLTRTIVYYSLLTVPLVALAGIAFYFIITSKINDSMDESLLNIKRQLENYLTKTSDISHYTNPDGESFITCATGEPDTTINFRDTLIFSNVADEYLPYRILTTEVRSEVGHCRIYIRKAAIETEDLINGIAISVLLIFSFLFIGLLTLNWWINRRLWGPFYRTLNFLERYKIGAKNDLGFKLTAIAEFNALNRTLSVMLGRASVDYQLQKEFTENASHEMQTPLAVMQSKIDLLIQSKNLGQDEMQLIATLLSSLKKLSHLNKSLLLLSKIENSQFKETEDVNMTEIVEHTLEVYDEAIRSKEVSIARHFKEDFVCRLNRGLCEILITNLVQNAIRHNFQKGNVIIEITRHQFLISNTGHPIENPSSIFDRFSKSDKATDSIGLGLAIAKKIAETSGLHIEYQLAGHLHQFTIQSLPSAGAPE